jgi:hypothetical protein
MKTTTTKTTTAKPTTTTAKATTTTAKPKTTTAKATTTTAKATTTTAKATTTTAKATTTMKATTTTVKPKTTATRATTTMATTTESGSSAVVSLGGPILTPDYEIGASQIPYTILEFTGTAPANSVLFGFAAIFVSMDPVVFQIWRFNGLVNNNAAQYNYTLAFELHYTPKTLNTLEKIYISDQGPLCFFLQQTDSFGGAVQNAPPAVGAYSLTNSAIIPFPIDSYNAVAGTPFVLKNGMPAQFGLSMAAYVETDTSYLSEYPNTVNNNGGVVCPTWSVIPDN